MVFTNDLYPYIDGISSRQFCMAVRALRNMKIFLKNCIILLVVMTLRPGIRIFICLALVLVLELELGLGVDIIEVSIPFIEFNNIPMSSNSSINCILLVLLVLLLLVFVFILLYSMPYRILEYVLLSVNVSKGLLVP